MKFYDLRDRSHKLRDINIFIGGRGIGKTYSAISYILERGGPFIYLRNTEVQITECCSAFGNPFKRWAADHDRDIFIKREGKHCVICERSGDDKPKIIGYALALSTFENLRGVDLSDVRIVLYDEFIERSPLRFDQFSAFSNFYETVNRNRELLGESALQVLMLSNAQKLNNQILHGYGLIPIIEGMIKSGQREYSSGGLFLTLPESEISALKKDTSIYKLSRGSKFFDEAISNKFANDNFTGIAKKPLVEYIGVCSYDDVYIYRHKSNGSFYITSSRCGGVAEYSSDNPFNFIRLMIPRLARAYANNKLFFESFTIKSIFIKWIS